jgi:periplasmic divalent cation tolerance protein
VSPASTRPTRVNTAPPGDGASPPTACHSYPVSGPGGTDRVQIQFTIDDPSRADAMVDDLLTRHLVACGQRMGPIVSRYWWNGNIERAEEWMVVLKTRTELVDRVFNTVLAAHPYETPELISFDIDYGTPDYLGWIGDVTSDPR